MLIITMVIIAMSLISDRLVSQCQTYRDWLGLWTLTRVESAAYCG